MTLFIVLIFRKNNSLDLFLEIHEKRQLSESFKAM